MKIRVLLAALSLVLAAPVANAASADDTARFLAGMPVPDGSPLAVLTKEPGWQRHAATFNAEFKPLVGGKLARIRAWSKAHITTRRATLYYLFSGPDYLYANSFFPNAQTYILAGLEPVGAIPDLEALPKTRVPGALRALQISLRSILSFSFFKTIDMDSELRANPLNGTLPILYIFIARSGKVISDVSLVKLGANGKGAKITFASPGGPAQTLYYFSTNLANGGFKTGGLSEFCEKFGEGDAFVKSASYLMHDGFFSQVREFLLQHSAAILEDDSGIPVSQFGKQWELTTFGNYLGPIRLFAGRGQPKLTELFKKQEHRPLDFGIGYQYQANQSNLLLAVKKAGSPSPAPPPNPASPPAPDTAPPTSPPAADPVSPPAPSSDKPN